jgi:lipopolysaccharide/colanic/teichoic acid biosynthesis glycosyltransferase
MAHSEIEKYLLPENILGKPRTDPIISGTYLAKHDAYAPTLLLENPVIRCFGYRFVKRVTDVIVAGIGLLLLSPFFLVISLLIKISTPGPIFFAWNVIGRGGRAFRGYKFRTMVVDADQKKKDLMNKNEMSGPVFKIQNDPRITPFGRILRKYSIDELPQLWSVLKGDMSLVGPRPAGPHEWMQYISWQRRKLSVTPGITCLWQVSGRNHIHDFNDWVRLDLKYIDSWSLWLDLRILARTVGAVVRGTGV